MKSRKKLIIVCLLFVLILATVSWLVLKPKKTTAPASQRSQNANFDKTRHSIDDPTSIWVVVNKKRPLSPTNYTPVDLTAVGNGQEMRGEAVTALQKMFQDTKKEKVTLEALSGFRSYESQKVVYSKEVSSFGQEVADKESARPGFSEHQTGFAIDVGGDGCNIDDCFGQTTSGKWVTANSHKYGFIIRYTPSKDSITGYRTEPWHLRYVGTELANELYKSGQTLEEFFGLAPAPTY